MKNMFHNFRIDFHITLRFQFRICKIEFSLRKIEVNSCIIEFNLLTI